MSLPEPEQPFDAPWQASAFALAVHLSQQGHFTWSEWTSTFGARRAGGGAYWSDWLDTLDEMLRAKHLGDAAHVATLVEAWREAYATTPHGTPVTLPPARAR
ncbi:MAG: nitrile hydratase accessory protein [Pseudomonadota bacterium]